MSRVIAWLFGLLLIIGLGGAVYSFYQRLEFVESVEKMTLEGEARKNPLYAARIFLNRMGIPARSQQSLQGLKLLPNNHTVLIVSSSRSTLSRQATDDLYAWVQSGGHLIIRTTVDYDYSDYLDEEEIENIASDDPFQSLLKIKTGGEYQ
jgi:LPS sulfotransferase NodH